MCVETSGIKKKNSEGSQTTILFYLCTVVAIRFGNDKCYVLQSLLVQYLRTFFHMFYKILEYNKAHFIFFGGAKTLNIYK